MAGAVTSVSELDAKFAFKDNYINNDKTSSPYRVAHPDATILASGPPRASSIATGSTGSEVNLVGATNSIAIMESQAVQPVKELGSARYIFGTNNNPVTIQMNSVLINGRNLLRTLYALGNIAGIFQTDLERIGDVKNKDVLQNLDYPIFSVPFGLLVATRSISQEDISAVYAEMCIIQNWAWRIQAGQSTVFTDCTILADRVLPIQWETKSALTQLTQIYERKASVDVDTGSAAANGVNTEG